MFATSDNNFKFNFEWLPLWRRAWAWKCQRFQRKICARQIVDLTLPSGDTKVIPSQFHSVRPAHISGLVKYRRNICDHSQDETRVSRWYTFPYLFCDNMSYVQHPKSLWWIISTFTMKNLKEKQGVEAYWRMHPYPEPNHKLILYTRFFPTEHKIHVNFATKIIGTCLEA